jgi:hypothetical protein
LLAGRIEERLILLKFKFVVVYFRCWKVEPVVESGDGRSTSRPGRVELKTGRALLSGRLACLWPLSALEQTAVEPQCNHAKHIRSGSAETSSHACHSEADFQVICSGKSRL